MNERVGAASFICPDWPAPASVKACVTTRIGGVSRPPYDGLNVAAHVGDDPASVRLNRDGLAQALGLQGLVWGTQVHGTDVLVLPEVNPARPECVADGFYSATPGQPCLVMTADCLPVFFCNRSGTEVAVAHAGWRGLAGGVLENTLARFSDSPVNIMAWLGPAIGPTAFEVGSEVRSAFLAGPGDPVALAAAFAPSARPGHYLADLYALARCRLGACGVMTVYGGQWCTYSDHQRFYSFRRQSPTGRMASIIWLV